MLPPRGFSYRQPALAPPAVNPAPAPESIPPKPELVAWPRAPDGSFARTVYRFRPLEPKQLPPIEPAAPREQSEPY
jgi:hypothetical protein